MRQTKVFSRRAIVLLCVVVTVLTALSVSSGAPVMAANDAAIAQKRNELSDLQKRQKELQKTIDSLGDDVADQQKKVNALNSQVDNLEKQIETYQAQIILIDKHIALQEKEIADLNAEIAQKEQEMEQILAQLKKRVKAITKTGNYSSFQMLFNTENYEDYLLKSQVIRLVSEHDQALREKAEAEKKEIAEKKATVEAEKADQEAKRAELASIKAELDAQYKTAESLYTAAYDAKVALQKKLGTYESEQAKIKKAEAEVEKEIQALVSGTTTTAKYNGTMKWPVPGAYGISCSFGQKKTYFHGGTDIWAAGINRKPVYAAADGVVVKAVKMHYSYGNYVMIDHGLDAGGHRIMTLYAHMATAPYVKEGQQVFGGTTQIGIVGSTGNSTGPHLHFEVRVDGKRVDPVGGGYIRKP